MPAFQNLTPAIRERIALIEAWLESQMAYHGLPGMSIAVAHDQEIVWARGLGLANLQTGQPAAPDTIYRIASISKLFTATAVMILRDAGNVELDAPVRRYLPWFSVKNLFPNAPETTLRQILTHTSGLPRESPTPYWEDDAFPTREEMIAALANQETALPSETRWKYSNLALALAGEVVAAVSGQTWEAFVHEHIFAPLGMTSSFAAIDPQHPRLAQGYGRRLPNLAPRALSPFLDSRGIAPAANIATTVEDLARFAMLQFRDGSAGGAQILRGSTLREMHRPQWVDPTWDAAWGIGFRILRLGGKTYVSHSGSVKGFRSIFNLSLPEKTAVIVLCNADDALPRAYSQKAIEWLGPVLNRPSGGVEKSAPPEWERFFGRYRNVWGDTQILALDGRLVMLDPSQEDPLLEADRLTPIEGNTFRIEAGSGYSDDGELLVFEEGANGEIVSIRTGGGRHYRVDAW